MKHTKSYIPNYPRPLLTRPEWMNLEGEWLFSFDDEHVGLKQKWFKDFPKNHKTIYVPYSYHTIKSGIGDTSYHPYMWYKKTISLEKHSNKRALLHFEAVDYESRLYINGQFVGSHIGGYNRFSFDITNYIVDGENTLIMYINDDLSKEKPRGKQRYKKENFECWYVETSGIWKTPWIEIVNETYINDINYVYDESTLTYTVNTMNKKEEHEILISIYDDEKLILEETSYNNQVSINLPNDLIKWNEHNPKLYDVVVSLRDKTVSLDSIKSYIGFRSVETKKDILINKEKPYFKMVLDQGYFHENHLTATEADILKDLLLIKDMGFNGIRKHEKLESQIYNYYCDILGIYTWQEMPSFYEFSDLSKTRYLLEYKEMINQYINHPSIITWVPFNESWGIVDVYNNKQMQDFTLEVYKLTKQLDSSRPVVTNDGWEHTLTDIVTFHNYKQVGKDLLATYQDIDKILNNEDIKVQPPKKAFAHGYSYKNQPMMMTEFAGIAFKGKDGWGYGESVGDNKEFVERLGNLVKAIREMDFFQGYCITQLTDVQQETNGLLYEDRTPKIDLDIIKKLL